MDDQSLLSGKLDAGVGESDVAALINWAVLRRTSVRISSVSTSADQISEIAKAAVSGG